MAAANQGGRHKFAWPIAAQIALEVRLRYSKAAHPARNGAMKFIRLYARVLALLGPEARLGWLLAAANVALAATQFGEPVLFGRIIDALVGMQVRSGPPVWSDLLLLVGAWAAFGLFTTACGVLVALHADRLAHRRRQVVLTG